MIFHFDLDLHCHYQLQERSGEIIDLALSNFNTISKYKYILSPLGNGNFVPMRYYESLFVKSIPLQQSTDNIISKFGNEITNNRGIFFKDINDLIKNLDNHKTHNNEEYFMEDFINDEILPLLI